PGRSRMLAGPGTYHPLRGQLGTPMRIATPFTPIEVGETDYFAFDFTPDVGSATIVSTSWTCTLGLYETAIDPTPQSRVLAVFPQTAVQTRSPADGSLQTRSGSFSVGLIGG